MANKKFKNKYRIESTRLKGWNYSSDAYYFITICVKNRKMVFGEIKNGFLCISSQGKIAIECWYDLPNHYPNCILDKFVLMPDHLHGIIQIDNGQSASGSVVVVETRRGASLRRRRRQNHFGYKRKFGPLQKQSISSIINHYKGAVTKLCKKKLNTKFEWQSRFHDRIIRDEKELYNKRKYILNNPIKWESDRNNSIEF